MSESVSPTGKRRSLLSARRIALLATVTSLGAVALHVVPEAALHQSLPTFTARAFAAESTARPVGFADIVEKVKPAVISVRVKVNGGLSQMGPDDRSPLSPGSPFERFFRRYGMPDGLSPDAPRGGPDAPRAPRGRNIVGQGSGFFISADGYAVTNNHVVDKADSVEVTADDGKTYTAKVIGTDPKTDIALIKIDERADFPYVSFADVAPRIGDWVLAVGNPFGLGGTVTAGIVSARGRDIGAGPYDDFIQIDAPVNKGNSGGPTFDVDGNVIGVNTAIFSPSGGSVGIAFAIPAETVKTVVLQLKDKGAVSRGYIGVQIQPVTADLAESLNLRRTEGALVSEPQPDSPAAKAGIKSGDVIVSANGQPVKDARDLVRKIGAMTPGTSVQLGVLRNNQERAVTLTLGELPKERTARARPEERETPSTTEPRLGLSLAPAGKVAGSGATEGVMVTSVSPDGPAAELGFKTGDVILEVGGKPVATPADVRKAFTDARGEGKRTILMKVRAGEAMRFVAIPIGRT